MKVYVTVGTTLFDALIATIDTEECLNALVDRGCTQLVLQIGKGGYIPRISRDNFPSLKISYYRYDTKYKEDIKDADFIISHAGAGSMMDALTVGKNLLVVVNTLLMNNHQLELAEAMAEKKYCAYTTCEELVEKIKTVDFTTIIPYPQANEDAFPQLIDSMIFPQDMRQD